MDRGSEFMAEVKSLLKDEYGITRKPITTRNPQANAIVERAHQTIHNLIRSQQIAIHTRYSMPFAIRDSALDGTELVSQKRSFMSEMSSAQADRTSAWM